MGVTHAHTRAKLFSQLLRHSRCLATDAHSGSIQGWFGQRYKKVLAAETRVKADDLE